MKKIIVLIIGIFLFYFGIYYLFYGYFPPKNELKIAKSFTGLELSELDKKIVYEEAWNPNGEGETILKYQINNIRRKFSLGKKFKKLPIKENVYIVSRLGDELLLYLDCKYRQKYIDLNCIDTIKSISDGYYFLEIDPNNNANYHLVIIDTLKSVVYANDSFTDSGAISK